MSDKQTTGTAVITKDILEAYRQMYADKNKQSICPHCGYCPHCGRGGYVPYYPAPRYPVPSCPPWQAPFVVYC